MQFVSICGQCEEMQVSKVRTKERSISIDIYTATHLCVFPIDLMLNRETLSGDEEFTV